MKKEYLFLLILISIFIISGCTSSKSFLGSGPNGIQIKFIQPESKYSTLGIDEGVDLPIEFELTNYAECQAIGNLCVKDLLNDKYGGVPEQCKEINFEEARINNKKPELDTQTFIFSSQPYSNLFKNEDTTLKATAKYNCQFIAGPTICTKSPLNQDKECKNFETISGSKLGSKIAPVTITSIEKQLGGSSNNIELKIKITLRKMSDGKVSTSNEFQENLKGNPLRIEIDYGESSMSCLGADYKEGIMYWKAKDTEKVINCKISLTSGEIQETPLNIRLNYEYEITKDMPIKINYIKQEEGI